MIGCEVEVWKNPDGELEPTLSIRHQVIREIRTFAPDLVLTHRIHDYHPDHRAVGLLVRDACYMVRVPNIVPDAKALPNDPVVACFADFFSQPAPFRADAKVDVEPVIDKVTAMLDCHVSQVYEWIPHTLGRDSEVPSDAVRTTEMVAGVLRPRALRCASLRAGIPAGRSVRDLRVRPQAETRRVADAVPAVTSNAWVVAESRCAGHAVNPSLGARSRHPWRETVRGTDPPPLTHVNGTSSFGTGTVRRHTSAR